MVCGPAGAFACLALIAGVTGMLANPLANLGLAKLLGENPSNGTILKWTALGAISGAAHGVLRGAGLSMFQLMPLWGKTALRLGVGAAKDAVRRQVKHGIAEIRVPALWRMWFQ